VKDGKTVVNYNISLSKAFEGKVTVSIPMGEKYEGKTLTILSCRDGQNILFQYRCQRGSGKLYNDTLAAYAVLDGQYRLIPYDGQYTIINGIKYPMEERQFKDVSTSDWYFAAIAYVHAMKIMAGVGADLFEPDGTTTRAMLAAILYRLEGSPAVSGTTSFTDVEADAWYTDAVIWAEQTGIVAGYDNGLFGTDDPITREQLAAILYRYSRIKGRNVSAAGDLIGFTDAGQVSAYAMDAVKWAVALGLIQGKGEDNIDPAANATRAEIAAITQRYLDIYTKVLLVDDDLLAIK
jgi:hypothetical protein